MTKEASTPRFLGWFSVGLGLAQLLAPGSMAELIGARDGRRSRLTLRFIGLRELAAGVGILTNRKPTGWLWARVAGDAMDLALLGRALTSPRANRERLIAAATTVVGISALDLRSSIRFAREADSKQSAKENDAMKVNKAVTINSSPEELYNFWHNFENLPSFMRHLESVRVVGPTRSHWKAKAPAGKTVEWDAEIVDDRPNELISWRSVEGSDIENSGSVRFVPAPGGRGTEVHVELQYDPPGGKAGALVAKLAGEEPAIQIADDLHALRQVIEVGEVTLSDGTLVGTNIVQRPAQPPEQPVA